MLDHRVGAHHDIGARRAEAELGELVGEAARVVGVGADDGAEPGDARHLIFRRIGEVDDDGAVVGTRVLAHAPLERVEHDLEAEVAIDVDVEAVAGVPVELGARFQLVGGMIQAP